MISRIVKQILSYALPRPIKAILRNYWILSVEFGQYRSIRDLESVDANGQPVPWFCYPAIEYIRQLDLSDKLLFEWGSGNSTRFWAQKCHRVVSVENDEAWHQKMKPLLPANVAYQLVQDLSLYPKAIHEYEEDFDIIVVDGRCRQECVIEALKKLKDDGMVILDNSERYGQTSAMLRAADLIEVDMAGFGPINNYTTTTSFYFRRNIRLKPLHDRQPMFAIGNCQDILD